jgi:cyclic beta-1,2-glucan synthetase
VTEPTRSIATDADNHPFRDELLTAERLAESARGVAHGQKWTAKGLAGTSPLLGMIEHAAAELSSYNETLSKAAYAQEPISPAAEWLLDNYYLIDEQVRAVRSDLPASYGRVLPTLTAGPHAGYPRIYDAIVVLLSHSDARADEEYLLRYIDGFQDVSPLTIGEVWAIPIMLRIALVENARRLARRVVETHRDGRAADAWADRLILATQDDPGRLRELIDAIEAETSGSSPSFLMRLSQRLSGRDVDADAINAWLERDLGAMGLSLEQLAHDLQQEQAADQVSIANSITSVRFLDAYEWKRFFETSCFVEQILREDPTGIYARMDFRSRDRYRHALEELSRHSPLSEIEVAEATVSLALQALTTDPAGSVEGHVGHYLISEGRTDLERAISHRPHGRELIYRGPLRHRALFYTTLLGGLTTLFAALLGWYLLAADTPVWNTLLLVMLATVPLSEVALTITNRVCARIFPPRELPKLDFLSPVAEAHRTLVVVPALLSSVSSVSSVLDNLEVAYLANRDANIAFGLLGDLRGGPAEHAPGDAEIIEAAMHGVTLLNERYEAEHGRRPFHALIRGRRHNKIENTWMGWERKRGALAELNLSLRGEPDTSFTHRMGDESFLGSVTFVLTLDADTLLPRDSARKLICTIAHPLNRARYDHAQRRVVAGYGLIQPRVSMALPASSRSFFAWLYSGITGIDPYVGAVSDAYQDVFGEGSFTGKGIYEVSVFNAVLEERFPDNTLLSHDLIEGNFLRTALASSIEVLDDHPANLLAHTARLHRWVRGDWQTLPWLGLRVPTASGRREPNPLSVLHRWKMIDNLRRSLTAPITLVLLTLGWALVPALAWAWPIIWVLVLFFPAYFQLGSALLFGWGGVPMRTAAAAMWRDFGRESARVGLALVLLGYQAHLMADAIVRALWRMYVSRRNLLEWETAADAERRMTGDLASFVRRLWPSSAISVVLLVPAVALAPVRGVVAIMLAVVWGLAPVAAWRISRITEPVPIELGTKERAELRSLARRTWHFFETFVTAEGHFLAPDNFQEDPKGEVAYRTSPTNIGLQLLSTLSAYDLGYITLRGLMQHAADTLNALAGLERFRGHFYNWYDTLSLQPLPPNYISTVDSGNLAGHLLVLRVGLLEASEGPLLGPQLIEGLADTVRMVAENLPSGNGEDAARDVRAAREQLEEVARDIALEEPPGDLGGWHALLARLDALVTAATRVANTFDMELATESVRDAHDMLGELAPWAPLLVRVPSTVATGTRRADLAPLLDYMPSLVGLAEGLEEALSALDAIAADPPGSSADEREAAGAWAAGVSAGIREARPRCVELLARLRLDASIAREMWEHTDFAMLFDSHRLLFSIGYSTAEGRLDPSFYDMLASECRLASFLAIAKGDVPQEHWFRLGRSLTAAGGGYALLSWSASMFEYLMPLLVMESWPTTLLDETYGAVVRSQMHYGAKRGVPWGVSESAFNAKDAQLTYQYQAFGIPGLGLKRGLSEDVVIAPYATVLALPLAPHEVVANLRELASLGARGRYGYYEAVDFTPGRVPAGTSRAVVKAYFAHHQGMSLVALGNTLAGGLMPGRFHRDPMVASAELLLQERVPRTVQVTHPNVTEVAQVRSIRDLPAPVTRSYPLADTPVPSTHFLSNGRYSVMVTNGGGGYSRWEGLAVNRYREDVTRDCWGQFVYLRDVDSGETWTAAYNPSPKRPDEYHVTFSADKAEYRRLDGDIETRMEVSVSPEDDVEIRRVTVTNRGREPRRIEVTSYFEVSLTEQAADQAHRSFSNLFVETEALPETHSLLFSRRPRSAEEHRFWGFHTMGCDADQLCEWSYETDRARFLGRLRQSADPVTVRDGGTMSCTVGAVLDPACAIRRAAQIPGGGSARFVFTTGVTPERETAVHLAEKYLDTRSAQRAIDLAWTAAQIELRDLGLSPAEAVVLQRLASRLLLTDPASYLKVSTPTENGLSISGLWSIGISGDFPILLVRIDDLKHAPLVRQALLAHQYWRHKGLVADLVVLNTRPSAYSDELGDRLRLLVRTGHALQLVDKPGGVFLRRADQMHPDVLNLLLSVARATLDGGEGSLELQLSRRGTRPGYPDAFVASREPEEPAVGDGAFERPDLLFDNGYGGFDPTTGEYVIVLTEGVTTPAPWINVMASPLFGCMVTEAGIGCTWALNSHENRITTWNNDPVSDGSGEVIYIRDEETGEFWSPTPAPARDSTPYVVRHGKGYTTFEHHCHGIEHHLEWFVPAKDPVRVVRLRLRNTSDRVRKLSVTQFVEWVLGSSRSKAQHQVVTWFDAERDILTAHNHYNVDFPGRASFLACDRPLHSWTASRTEFVGRNRRPADPAAMYRKGLGGLSGRYHDNCGALMVPVELEPGAETEVAFLLGQTDTPAEARDIVDAYRAPGAAEAALAGVREHWGRILSTIEVSTPDPALDLLVNGQLLYQVLSCRLWGRTATYQSSGAYGFRDQLQDVLALLHVRPDLVREQIVEASRHQFERGDVLHWWQPFSGRGVRTRITDDRHWLPFVTAAYVEATGDESVLDELTAYIEAPEVEPGREDNYVQPAISETAASVYEHCVAALESGRGTGPHGLPLIGGGDWNDGMNRVGIEGRGESVWMGWFLDVVLTRFAVVCESRGDHERAGEYRAWAARLIESVERDGWDGGWYRRAYFDDGTPLGSKLSEECRIDAIAQSWAMISGHGDPDRALQALDAVEDQLVQREEKLIRLLTPPFDRMPHDPGYIKGYVPGVRENGGQYTHAAIWVVLGYLLAGDGDEARGLLELINPINHALTREDADLYRVEPYVVAADVYGAEPHVGRGGWTWYTGSASWFYRLVVEHQLGLRVIARDGIRHLQIDPCIPKSWNGFEMSYRFGETEYRISVKNPRRVNRGVAHVELDGRRLDDDLVPLADDGVAHVVVVRLLGG